MDSLESRCAAAASPPADLPGAPGAILGQRGIGAATVSGRRRYTTRRSAAAETIPHAGRSAV